MKKRLITTIILIVMMISTLTGCTLFEHNYERDYQQVVAVINPMALSYYDTNEDGVIQYRTNNAGEIEAVTATHTSEKYEITKSQLINSYMNNYGESGTEDVEGALNDTLEGLVTRKLIIEYAKARMYEGSLIVFNRGKENQKIYKDITASLTDMNKVWMNVYTVINNQIFSTGNEILAERNEPERTKGETAAKETTYKVQPDYDTVVEYEFEDTKPWEPDAVSFPGATDYLYQTATVRFARNLIETLEKDTTLTKAEKAKIKEDKNLLDATIAKPNGNILLYGELKNFYSVEKYIYKDQLESQLITRLQQLITEDVNVSDSDIQERYNDLLKSQKNSFDNSSSAYETALDGTDPVLYYTDAKGYYYVKHILIPFSEAQTKSITEFNKRNAGKTNLITANRKAEAEKIMSYAHIGGEDYGNPVSVKDIYNEVASAINSRNSHYDKERAFDSFIYRYNTDPGIFEKAKGYLVKPSGNSFVKEFQDAADKLYEDGKVGALSDMIVTEFGVHIMYLSSIVSPKTAGLFEHETAAKYNTKRMYDIIKEKLKTEKQNNKFERFINDYISEPLGDEDIVVKYEKRYKDLWDK